MEKLKGPLQLAFACAVVGVLTTFGAFDSIADFPLVFAFFCLVFGGWSLWRERPRQAIALRSGILVLGAGLAVGGWLYHQRQVELSLIAGRERVLGSIQGRSMPVLVGLEPLNTDRAAWDAASSLDAPATIVTFWARWCSPCEKEMAVLEELYREHSAKGLRVLAVARYDHPNDEEDRQGDFVKAQRWLEKRELTYPAAITDSDDLIRAYEAVSIPRTLLIDGQGRVVDYAIGLESAMTLMDRAVELVDAAAVG